jgi:diaminohydroxyphosphoribosylaminopyrimidine deaminase/5-amino-6-(5-phosphoribosylamino)uracil reductase
MDPLDPMDQQDRLFMREALRQAGKGLGWTSPNPAVGAVVVSEGRVIARGYHRRAGGPHAEIEALNRLGGRAMGATLYVTLEPCNHTGRTPPCTEAILRSGIRRVVAGMRDPNPHVRGGGCALLAARGLEVKVGVLEADCLRLNEAFVKFVTTGRPFVISKSALTLDGWTATVTGDSRWITNESSRALVHRMRSRTDAVMVGVGTVLSDDPRLTARSRGPRARDPIRIVLDTRLRTPREAKILNQDSAAATVLVVGEDVPEARVQPFTKPGVRVERCPLRAGKIDLVALMDILKAVPVTSLLLEGGATLTGAMMRERLIDKFHVFLSSKILGGSDGVPMAAGPGAKEIAACVSLKDLQVRRFGTDLLVSGYPDYP